MVAIMRGTCGIQKRAAIAAKRDATISIEGSRKTRNQLVKRLENPGLQSFTRS